MPKPHMVVCSLLNHCSLTPYVITIVAADSETHTHNSIDPLTACNPLTAAGYSLLTIDVMICTMTCNLRMRDVELLAAVMIHLII